MAYTGTRVSLQRARVSSGAEAVRGEVELINRRYSDLLAQLNTRLQKLQGVYRSQGKPFPVSTAGYRS